jgi:hypothetical protein
MNEQYHATIQPMADWPARAAPTCVHDALGAVVTAHRAAMVAWLPVPTLAARCGEISGRRTGATSLLRHVELTVKHILTFS